MAAPGTILLLLLLAYGGFVAWRLGVHQRLPLALRPLSLELILDRAAGAHDDRVLFTTDRPVGWEIPALREHYQDPCTWSALRIKSSAGYLATLFRNHLGVRRGDRIAIMKTNHLDVHVFTAAAVRAGGIACPINGYFEPAKLFAYLLNIGARILVTDTATLSRVIDMGGSLGNVETVLLAEKRSGQAAVSLPPRCRVFWIEEMLHDVTAETPAIPRGRDEPLYLVHSSGTTGFPKAVILKNGSQAHAVRGWLCYVHASRRLDKALLAVPNNHQAVILTFNCMLLLGLRGRWMTGCHRDDFDPESAVRELENGAFTGFFGFPVTYTLLKEVDFSAFDLRRMHFWAATADASHEIVERKCVAVGSTFRRLGIPIPGSVFLDAQGSSEVGTPSVIRYYTRFTRKYGRRIGRPGSTPFGPKIRVASPEGDLVGRREAGRLLVKGRTLFAGYWNDHAMTDSAVRSGWFFTGDIVRRGGDGHLIQLDREVDVIRTKSGDVYSLPMEEVIHKHPAVFDVCVYGARQADGWQRPAGAVSLRDGWTISQDELMMEFNASLPEGGQLCMLDVISWEDFPMGCTGKTLKRVFREKTEPDDVIEMNWPAIAATY